MVGRPHLLAVLVDRLAGELTRRAIATRAQEITQFLAACGAGITNAPKEMAMSSQSQNPSRRKNALLMATAACAPSAMAAATKRTSRDTSPATYTPGTLVSSVSGVHHDATLRIPLAAKTLRKVRCLMAAGREE